MSYAPYRLEQTAHGNIYIAPKEWYMTFLYKALKAQGYTRNGLIAALGNISRESYGGKTYLYELGGGEQTTDLGIEFPHININDTGEDTGTWSASIGTSVDYQPYSVTYTKNVDNGSIDLNTWLNEYNPISGTNGTGYGIIQWTNPSWKRHFYDITYSLGKTVSDPNAQIDLLDWTFDDLTSDPPSLWNIYNPSKSFLPNKVMKTDDTSYAGNSYWVNDSDSYAYKYCRESSPYFDATRVACCYWVEYIERPYQIDTSVTTNYSYNRSRYVFGSCWVEFCEEYADQFDHSALGISGARGMPIWMYPSLRRKV